MIPSVTDMSCHFDPCVIQLCLPVWDVEVSQRGGFIKASFLGPEYGVSQAPHCLTCPRSLLLCIVWLMKPQHRWTMESPVAYCASQDRQWQCASEREPALFTIFFSLPWQIGVNRTKYEEFNCGRCPALTPRWWFPKAEHVELCSEQTPPQAQMEELQECKCLLSCIR